MVVLCKFVDETCSLVGTAVAEQRCDDRDDVLLVLFMGESPCKSFGKIYKELLGCS